MADKAASEELKKLQAQLRQAKKMAAKHAPAVQKHEEAERVSRMPWDELSNVLDRNRDEYEYLSNLKDSIVRHNLLARTSKLTKDATKGRDARSMIQALEAEIASKKKKKGEK